MEQGMVDFKKIPVDIVLLPSVPIRDLAIQLSNAAYTKGENPILRGINDRIPHISLLMGCLHQENKEALVQAVDHIAKKTQPLPLSIIDQYCTNEHGGLEVEKNKQLTTLQEEIIVACSPLLHTDCSLADLVEEEPLDSDAKIYVNDFISGSVGENFWPHITTHHKTPANLTFPIHFTGARLAICPMGNHGTCRTPIALFDLI